MSLAPPSRAGRISMSGMFAGPRSGPTMGNRTVDPFAQGMFSQAPQMPQGPQMPAIPGPQGPQMPPQMPPQQGPSFPPVMPNAGNPGVPTQPAQPTMPGGYQSGEQAAGHAILIPSITALMTGIATSRPADPNMMWDTGAGKWTSDLSAYTRK